MRQIKRIFVHCTAGNQKTTLKDLEQEFKNKGWKYPGYHYVVFPDGKIEQMLDESLVSNGVQGYNSTAINVAYVGGVDSKLNPIDNRTEAQKDSLEILLDNLKETYPDAHIMGHRDIWGKDPKDWKKQCPCFDAEAEYAHIGDEEYPIPDTDLEAEEEEEGSIDEETMKFIEYLKSLGYTEEQIFDGGEEIEKEIEELRNKEQSTKEESKQEAEIKEPWWKRCLTTWKSVLKFLKIIK